MQGYYPTAPRLVRPSGVTILAILYFIEGVVAIIGFFALAYVLAGFTEFALICGGIGILIGVLNFVIGWGLWTLQGWAHTTALVFAILGLLNFPIGTIISIIVLIYLFQPEVKAAFGKGPPPVAPGYYPPPGAYPYQYSPQPAQPWGPPPTAPPPAPPPSPPPGESASSCPTCGRAVVPGTTFCPNCGARLH